VGVAVWDLGAVRALRRISAEQCDDAFAPPPTLTVSEWADRHRRLSSKTSASPGQWRTDRVPYLRRIQDVLGDESVREVVFAKSAQVGGSSAAENFVGYLMDQAPCAILEVWPTEKALRAWSTKRLDPLLDETPCLAEKFPKSGRRDSDNSIASKEFPGGYIQALTAKSTADLRSHSARVAIAEEIDEWEGDVNDQGDPLALLRARLRTFWNSKLFMVSTPTADGASRVWHELESSTWEEYWVPCPHCGHEQTLRWRDGDERGGESGAYRLVWEKDESGEPIAGSVCYVCEGCAALIEERHKPAMLAVGEWRARFPGRRKVGFHINTLCSPLCPWLEVAQTFTSATKHPAEMKSFDNTVLGVPHKQKGESVDKSFLQRRAERYPMREDGESVEMLVPAGVGALTAGVDVQGDRLEPFVWGWGDREESWFLPWPALDGDPAKDEVWSELEALLLRAWPHEGGATLRIAAAAIDAGYQPERVHRFCSSRAGRNVIPVIGRDGRGRALLAAPDPRVRMKKARKDQRPNYVVGVDSAKDLFFGQLRIALPEGAEGAPGCVHFPDTTDPVIYDQLTAEKLVTEYVAGRPVRKWTALPGRRNEALDGRNYAAAALALLGSRFMATLGDRAKALMADGEALRAAAESPPAETDTQRAAPKTRRGWITRY
jgi:phage terminase large subunit GpA-like protein